MKSSPRAFTLIELAIVILIIAILTVALASSFFRGNLSARFNDQLTQVVQILEEARGYSLGSTLIEDSSSPGTYEPAEHYRITIGSNQITLDAVGPTIVTNIKTVTIEPGFVMRDITPTDRIFYFAPDGEICFDTYLCDSGITRMSFILSDSTNTYTQTIRINQFGGYPELD